MATLDNDFVRLHLLTGPHNIPLKAVGLEWPPPERLYLEGDNGLRPARDGDLHQFVLVRTGMSQLPDAVADNPHIARGAEYQYAVVVEATS